MKPHCLKAYVKPHAFKRENYAHIEHLTDKPPIQSYVVLNGLEVVFESSTRGKCNQFILNNPGKEYEVKAVRG